MNPVFMNNAFFMLLQYSALVMTKIFVGTTRLLLLHTINNTNNAYELFQLQHDNDNNVNMKKSYLCYMTFTYLVLTMYEFIQAIKILVYV